MTPLEELSDLLTGSSRVVVLAEKDVDLRSGRGDWSLVVMKMVEGSLAAGGRGAGFGERRITKVALYRLKDGKCEKPFETEDESRLAGFEVPYYVSRLPFVLEDGSEVVGYGAVDPGLVAEYSRRMV
ncbi:MAG TPA: hypothetical protein VEC02_05115 [Nitrososphaerales archaeon]|nr:hypothetical protein [Nitrososphaerales archaeon]